MRVNLQSVLSLARNVEAVVNATLFSIETIEVLSDEEARGDVAVDYAALPQLDQPGPYGTRSQRWELVSERQNPVSGQLYQRKFYVDVVRPDRWQPGKTPVIVFSHGLWSDPGTFQRWPRIWPPTAMWWRCRSIPVAMPSTAIS